MHAWTIDGKAVLDSQGRLIICEQCPCPGSSSSVPKPTVVCEGIELPSELRLTLPSDFSGNAPCSGALACSDLPGDYILGHDVAIDCGSATFGGPCPHTSFTPPACQWVFTTEAASPACCCITISAYYTGSALQVSVSYITSYRDFGRSYRKNISISDIAQSLRDGVSLPMSNSSICGTATQPAFIKEA